MTAAFIFAIVRNEHPETNLSAFRGSRVSLLYQVLDQWEHPTCSCGPDLDVTEDKKKTTSRSFTSLRSVQFTTGSFDHQK